MKLEKDLINGAADNGLATLPSSHTTLDENPVDRDIY